MGVVALPRRGGLHCAVGLLRLARAVVCVDLALDCRCLCASRVDRARSLVSMTWLRSCSKANAWRAKRLRPTAAQISDGSSRPDSRPSSRSKPAMRYPIQPPSTTKPSPAENDPPATAQSGLRPEEASRRRRWSWMDRIDPVSEKGKQGEKNRCRCQDADDHNATAAIGPHNRHPITSAHFFTGSHSVVSPGRVRLTGRRCTIRKSARESTAPG